MVSQTEMLLLHQYWREILSGYVGVKMPLEIVSILIPLHSVNEFDLSETLFGFTNTGTSVLEIIKIVLIQLLSICSISPNGLGSFGN